MEENSSTQRERFFYVYLPIENVGPWKCFIAKLYKL